MNAKKPIALVRSCVLSLATIFILNGSGGIAASGETPDTTKVSSIQKETTTTGDVRAMCGQLMSTRNTESSEDWSSSYQENRSLDVYLDKAVVVTNYRYKAGVTHTPMGQKVQPVAGEKPGTVHCDLCPIYCTRTVCDLNKCRTEKYVCQWESCNCRGE